jgi:LuxR family transcriptional regulator, maltose regulon positive regulatory protein
VIDVADRRSALARGQTALAERAWSEARAAFEAALRESETAQAYEGLSWAAWWLNDGDLTIRSREAAHRLHRDAGDNLGAARMAMWVGSDYEDFRGEFAVGQGWRQRAHRLIDGLPPAPEHGWLAIFEAEVALLFNEDMTTAQTHAIEAIAWARQSASADIEIMALGIEGLALVGSGEVERGMRRLDEAAAATLAGELKEEAWANKVLCYLIFACERVRDFDRAAQWCTAMREVADRMQLTFAQAICRWHYAGVLISRGKWAEAEAELADAMVLVNRSRPPYAAEGLVSLANLRRRQGRLDEAADMLRTVEWHPLALVGLGEIALDAGKPVDAEDFAERYLRQVPEGSRMQRAAALEVLVRASALNGRQSRANEAMNELKAVSDSVGTAPLRAAAAFSGAAVAMADGDYEGARADLQDAVDLFERSGTPYESARARLELASVLVTLDRLDSARDQARAAQQTLNELGAVFSARRAATLLRDIDRRPSTSRAAAGATLTQRQAEILRLVSDGRTDRQIAAALGVSEHTVHRHIANILDRLDLPTRAAAVAHATSRRLL